MRTWLLSLIGLTSSFLDAANMTPIETDDDWFQSRVSLQARYTDHSSGAYSSQLIVPIVNTAERAVISAVNYSTGQYGQTLSLDLGYRWITEQNHFLGLFLGYDSQHQASDYYQQFAVNAEWRSGKWHSVSNVYLPLQKQSRLQAGYQWQLSAPDPNTGLRTIDQRHLYESPSLGIETKVGYQLSSKWMLQTYVGGYHYQGQYQAPVTGVSAELSIDLYNHNTHRYALPFVDKIQLRQQYRYDQQQQSQWATQLNFIFTIGQQHKATGMTAFLLDPVDRQHQIRTHIDDQAPWTPMTNDQGNPLTFATIENEQELNQAQASGADILAINGDVQLTKPLKLQPEQTITGGEITLSNGLTISLGQNGHLLGADAQPVIVVSQNNQIEHLQLTAATGQNAITNAANKATEKLTINDVSSSGSFEFRIHDPDQTSDFVLTNNQINMGDSHLENAITIWLEAGSSSATIENNKIHFGKGDSNQAVYITAPINTTGDVHFTDIAFNNNDIKFEQGDSNSGLRVNFADNEGDQISMNISRVQGNQFSFNGSSNAPLSFNVDGSIEATQLSLNHVINNQVTFGSGNNNYFLLMTAGLIYNHGNIEVNGIYNNQIQNASLDFYAFNQGSITINVGDGTKSLAQANHIDASQIVTQGDVVINPE